MEALCYERDSQWARWYSQSNSEIGLATVLNAAKSHFTYCSSLPNGSLSEISRSGHT